MSPLDIEIITERKAYWTQALKAQEKLKKIDRDLRVMSEAKKRIAVIDTWLYGVKEEPKPLAPSMSKEEFNEEFKKALGDTSKPEAVIEVNSISEVDALWPKIYMKNIQLKFTDPAIGIYIRKKAAETRPYQFKNKNQ